MDAGAELRELDAVAGAVRDVAAGLGEERRRLGDLLAVLGGAAGLPRARRACDEAGDALVPALGAVRLSADVLSADATQQGHLLRRADGVR